MDNDKNVTLSTDNHNINDWWELEKDVLDSNDKD